MEKTPAFVLQPCICYMILGKAEALPRNLIYLIHGHALTLLTPKGRGFSVQRPLPAPVRSYIVSLSVLVWACPALP